MSPVMDLLRDAVRLYRAHASLLSGLFAWLLLPFAVVEAATFIPNESLSDLVYLLGTLFVAVLAIWLTALSVRLIHGLSHGQKIDLIKLREEIKPLLLPYILVALLQSIVILGGLILFIVPGFVFSIWYAFAEFATLLDSKRGMEALSASRSLVRGRFWSVCWRVIGGPLLIGIVYSVAMGILLLVGFTVGVVDLPTAVSGPWPVWLEVIDMIAQTLLITPLLLVYSVLLYQKLKETKKAG